MRAVLLLCSLSFLFHLEFRLIYFQLSQLLNLDFPVAQTVKSLPAMQETRVRSLGWEDPLEKEMATHPSILAWRIRMDRGAWRATAQGVAKSRTRLSD